MQIIEILIRIWGEYAVVEFTDTNEVELVPVSWITSDKKECFWPNFRSTSKQKMAVRQGMLPNSTEFKKFVVKIMYQTKDYEKARKKLKEAECKSDLQTEAEEEEVTKKRTKSMTIQIQSQVTVIRKFARDRQRKKRKLCQHCQHCPHCPSHHHQPRPMDKTQSLKI